jgi:hypothetical protein
VPKWAIVGALWLWFAVALLTHHGAASPYSYATAVVGSTAPRIDGQVVNPDAPSVRPVTQFFFDGTDFPFREGHNLKLPLHSMIVAAIASFVRSYVLANDLANLLALWLLSYVAVTFAESLAYPRAATLLASLTCAALPFYAHYIGQPMQYIVGPAINFLVMIAVMAGVRDPVRLGLLTAVLTLNYDPYVFLAALVTWIALTIRWSAGERVAYGLIAFVPVLLWRGFLATISTETVSAKIRGEFLEPLAGGWLSVLADPVQQLLTPFVNGHVGVVVSLEMTLALVYWPVLIVGLLGLRPKLGLPALLVLFFVLEQIVVAAYDWESNPRRALPILFAFSCAYFTVVRERLSARPWRIAFVAVLLLSAFLTMSDTITRNPVVGYMHTGEAMRDPTKDVLTVAQSRMESYSRFVRDERPRWWDMGSATPSRPLVLAVSNLFAGAFVVGLLIVLRERSLLPRHVPLVAGAVFLVSLGARFL